MNTTAKKREQTCQQNETETFLHEMLYEYAKIHYSVVWAKKNRRKPVFCVVLKSSRWLFIVKQAHCLCNGLAFFIDVHDKLNFVTLAQFSKISIYEA